MKLPGLEHYIHSLLESVIEATTPYIEQTAPSYLIFLLEKNPKNI